MATDAEFQAAIDAIRRAHPGWQLPADLQVAQSLHLPGSPLPNEVFDLLRKAAPLGVFDANGQIAHPRPGVSAPILPRPGAPNLPPPPQIPGPASGPPIDRNLKHPSNKLNELQASDHHFKNAKNVPHDQIQTFIDGYNAIISATEHGPQNSSWDATITAVDNILRGALRELKNGFTGQAASALNLNLTRSFQVLHEIGQHTHTMETLFQTFFDDLGTTKQNFEQYAPLYNKAIEHPDEPSSRETLRQLNDLVVGIMNVYRDPIDGIAASHPSVNSAVPDVGPPTGGPAGANIGAPGGSGGGVPQSLPRGGLNTGESSGPASTNTAQPDEGQSSPNSPASGAGDGTGAGGDQGGQGGGQGSDAASKALGDTFKGDPKGGTGLPAGMLGLGAKGLPGTSKTGGGGRGGGGTGGRGISSAKSPTKVTAAPKLANSTAAVSRAGVSGAGGSGAAGTPVAGHQGKTTDKTHRASKALRLPKNGEELVGESDSVVPVIGHVPRKATPAQPET